MNNVKFFKKIFPSIVVKEQYSDFSIIFQYSVFSLN